MREFESEKNIPNSPSEHNPDSGENGIMRALAYNLVYSEWNVPKDNENVEGFANGFVGYFTLSDTSSKESMLALGRLRDIATVMGVPDQFDNFLKDVFN